MLSLFILLDFFFLAIAYFLVTEERILNTYVKHMLNALEFINLYSAGIVKSSLLYLPEDIRI